MTAAPTDASAQRCGQCGAPLAHDQRYCLLCGERRGPLPRPAAAAIAAILEQGRSVPVASGPAANAAAPLGSEPASLPDWMPAPRVAAVAILCMLAFGVVVGSLAGTGFETLANAPVLLAVSPPSTPAAALASAAGAAGAARSQTAPVASESPAAASPPAPQASQAGAAPAAQTVTAGSSTPSSSAGAGSSASGLLGLPPIKHVFLIVLSDRGYSHTFGSRDGYFASTLRKQGRLLEYYYGVTAGPLANEIALISGQGPTPQTAADCPVFAPLRPAAKGSLGQALGTGCVYPQRIKTLAGQLSRSGRGGWRAYVQGIGDGPAGSERACRHPALGGGDSDQAASRRDPYVTWRNPFVYFQSIIDAGRCRTDDVALVQLAKDLKTASTTPAQSYIVPSPCDDGAEQPCAPGARFGLAAAAEFLTPVIREIERSPAYKSDGLIAITFDQAPQTGPHADPTACCDAQTFPNLATSVTAPGAGTTTTVPGPGTAPTPVAPVAGGTGTTATGPVATATATTPAATATATPPAATATGPAATATATTPAATATGPAATGTATTPADTTPATASSTSATTTTTTTTGAATAPATSTVTATTTGASTPTTPALSGGQTTPTGGGGRVGLLLISPYVKPGSVDDIDYFNHFSLLASIENIFGLAKLGYASDSALPVFDASVFDAKR